MAFSSTIDVAGDWTTTGGLIGKSAMVTSGGQDLEGFTLNHETNNPNGSQSTQLSYHAADSGVGYGTWGATDGWTVEAWVKFDSFTFGSDQGVIAGHCRAGGTGDSYGGGIQIDNGTDIMGIWAGSNDITWKDGGCSFRADTYMTVGKWHHLAFTVDNRNSATPVGKLYLDGKLMVQHTGASVGPHPYPFNVGGPMTYANKRVDANFGRVSIWKTELYVPLCSKTGQ